MKFDELMVVLKLMLKLEHAKGRRIFLLIAKNPGIRFAQIKNITGYDSNDLNHALLKLRKLGLVVSDDGNELTEVGNRMMSALESLKGDEEMNLLFEEMKKTNLVDVL